MNTTRTVIVAAALVLLASATESLGIEGLQVSVQCPDVILGWPSNPGENYIVQWRPSLVPGTPWATLTNSLPADWTTNWTVFVDSGRLQSCPPGNDSMVMSSMATASVAGDSTDPSIDDEMRAYAIQVGQMMVRPADGSGMWLPLGMYWPGFDLSAFTIMDPSTGETMSGAGYVVSQPSLNASQLGDIQPLDDDPEDPPPADPGFYQVVRDGVHVVGLTNLTSGPVSNTITISFEAGNAIGTLQEIYVLVDGLAYRGADALLGPPFYPGTVAVDTSYLENGDHMFQLGAGWVNPDIGDLDNATFQRTSDPFTLTVSNEIYYPDWEDEVGELGFSAYFAKTIFTDVDWRIDIFDVSNNFVQALTGHTTDGTIEAPWNLVDTNGVSRTNADTDPEFTSMITVAGAVPKPGGKKKSPPTYPTHAQWVIAYQDTFGYVASSNSYYQAIYDFGGIASQFGGAVTVLPSSPTNGQTFPMRFPYTNPVVYVSGGTMLLDDHALTSLLTNATSRNFYYNGHGSPNTFGGFLTSWIITEDLRGHYYRFVFLDACLTSLGGLPGAFGISSSTTEPLSYYQAHGIRPRAFLGYDHIVHYLEGSSGGFYDPVTGQTYSKRVKEEVYEFLENFEFFWYYGYYGGSLTESLYYAYTSTPPLPYGVWQNGDGLQTLGYDGLTIDGYNWRSNWSN